MNKGLIGILSFVAGGLVGFFGAMSYYKKKYEQISNEEIESVRQMYKDKLALAEKEHEEHEEKKNNELSIEEKKKEKAKYLDLVKRYNGDEEDEEDDEDTEPYEIAPEQFGEDPTYNQVRLTYYADGSLVDEDNELVERPEYMVGLKYKALLGSSDDGRIYIRNEELGTDYEINADDRSWE